MTKDLLDLFKNMSSCSNCGCIDTVGTFRCVGCGTFHSNAHLVDREAPPLESRTVENIALDPSAYSMGPGVNIPEEDFEESDEVRSWLGSTSDFSLEDDETTKFFDSEDKSNLTIVDEEEL